MAQGKGSGLARRVLNPVIRKASKLDVVKRMARSGEYQRYRDLFVMNNQSTEHDAREREEIVRRFEKIDESVPIASTPVEGLMLAEIMLSLDCPGDVVECGCFSGGSSAKLSIVAEVTGRKLVVCDSFEGLPEVDEDNLNDFHARRSSDWVTPWTAGRYASRMEQVQDNVRQYGCVDVCSFVKGWFCDSLTDENLPQCVAMAFVDVDIASSARDCIVPLWPLMPEKSVFVSHDVAYIKVMQTFYDRDLWENVLKDWPPIFFGAGFGMGDLAPHVGFAVKGNASAEYINTLTLEK